MKTFVHMHHLDSRFLWLKAQHKKPEEKSITCTQTRQFLPSTIEKAFSWKFISMPKAIWFEHSETVWSGLCRSACVQLFRKTSSGWFECKPRDRLIPELNVLSVHALLLFYLQPSKPLREGKVLITMFIKKGGSSFPLSVVLHLRTQYSILTFPAEKKQNEKKSSENLFLIFMKEKKIFSAKIKSCHVLKAETAKFLIESSSFIQT